MPDEYYLPSLKIQADFGTTKLISNTSYYHRNELTAYQGTVYDLAYFQCRPGLDRAATASRCGPAASAYDDAAERADALVSAARRQRHPSAARVSRTTRTPNTITNQQRTWTQEIRLQSNDNTSA